MLTCPHSMMGTFNFVVNLEHVFLCWGLCSNRAQKQRLNEKKQWGCPMVYVAGGAAC